jgi:hypothetical protein
MDFWSKRISNSDSLKPVRRGTALRFFVSTASDLAAFHKALTQELLGVEWTQEPNPAMIEDEESQPAASASG